MLFNLIILSKYFLYWFIFLYFVGFYCIGFSIKLVKNRAWNENQCNFTTSSHEVHEKGSRKKGTWEVHAGSWRVKCQATFRNYFVRQVISQGTYKTLYLEDFECDFLTLHPYYIYPHYPQNKREAIQRKKTLDRFLQHNTPTFKRESYSSFIEKSL